MSEPVSESTPVELRERAEDILARPEFGEPGESWPERVFRWVGDRFDSLFEGLGAGEMGWLMIMVVLTAVVALIAWALRSWRPASGGSHRRLETRMSGTGEPALGATDWRAEARAHEAAGRWAEAIRCHHRALTAELGALGAVDDAPSSTARELADEMVLRSRVEEFEAVSVASDFDEAWYGSADLARGDVERFVTRTGQLGSKSRRS